MFKKLVPLSAVALTAWSGLALAQESSTETQTEATEAPAAEATEAAQPQSNGAAQLDLGQPEEATPQIGQRYSKEKFGDWDLACIRTGNETDPCSLLQIVNGSEGNPMAEFSLFRLPEGQRAVAAATVIVPLETLLTAQLAISIDGGPRKRYNYTVCSPVGCVAQIGFTQADVDALKKGSKATMSIVPYPAPDQVVELEVSLKGFTAGFDKVDVVEN